jgi:mxaJ protein
MKWLMCCPVLFLALAMYAAGNPQLPELRVCADPNNLPFSNDRAEGFENRIAGIVGNDLGMRIRYVWWPQRRGFVRNTLSADLCDVVPGIGAGVDSVITTMPYYRSAYAFVSSRTGDSRFRISSFDAPELRSARIGVQIIGDDYANTPPVHLLAQRKIVGVKGYRVMDDYGQPNPPSRIVEAVAKGEVDVAIVWGPVAGFFAARQRPPLQVTLADLQGEDKRMPLTFDIAMGVRKNNLGLKQRLDAVLTRRRAEIARILTDFHVPVLPLP